MSDSIEDAEQETEQNVGTPTEALAPLDQVGKNPPSAPAVVPQQQGPEDSWAQAFPKETQTDPWDNAFPDQVRLNGRTLQQTLSDDAARFSFGQIGNAFVRGWNGVSVTPPEGWNIGPESEALLKAIYTYPEIDKTQQSRWQAFNNAFLYPAVRALAHGAVSYENQVVGAAQLPLQLGGALFGAGVATVGEAVKSQLGPAAGREAAALAEFLPTHTTGMPHPAEAPVGRRVQPGEVVGEAPAFERRGITPGEIDAAREQGVIGPDSQWDGTSVYSHTRDEAELAPPADVHAMARQIDPETFEEYDRLRAVHDLALQEFRDETERARAEVEASPSAHGERLSEIGAELNDLENVPNDRYVYRRRNQLLREQERLRDEREEYLANAPDLTEMVLRSPENLQLRNFIADNAQRMQALEGRVRDVYAEAANRMPEEAPASGVAEAAQPDVTQAPEHALDMDTLGALDRRLDASDGQPVVWSSLTAEERANLQRLGILDAEGKVSYATVQRLAAERARRVRGDSPTAEATTPAEAAHPAPTAQPVQPAPADFLAERRGLEGPVQVTIGETTTTQHGIAGDVALHNALGIAGGEGGISPTVWAQAIAHAKSIGRADVADAIQRRWESERTSVGVSGELRADGDRLIGRPQQPTAPLDIATHAADQFRQAGRPEQEASDLGALADAYYKAKAARFQGAKGTAEDLYLAEFPSVVGRAQGPRGASGMLQRSGGRSILTLFAKADPSTAIHELGHNWTLDLLRDAQDPAAPASLVRDAETIRAWLNVSRASEKAPSRASATTGQIWDEVQGLKNVFDLRPTLERLRTLPQTEATTLMQQMVRGADGTTPRQAAQILLEALEGKPERLELFEQAGRDAGVVTRPIPAEVTGEAPEPVALNVRQQERMARGFETYMREGTAPTAKLAGVFERFKDWLTTVYQTLKNRQVNINDDIRGVFDRWFAGEGEQRPSVVAAEPAAPPRVRTPQQIMAENPTWSPNRVNNEVMKDVVALADWQRDNPDAAARVREGRKPPEAPQEAPVEAARAVEPALPEADPPEQAAEVAPEPVAKNFGPEAKPEPPRPDRSRPYMRVPKEPQRLLEFMKEGVINETGVRLFGRLKDPGGDLAAALGDRALVRRIIDNQNGESLDDFARRAADAGYFNGLEPETDAGVIDRIVADVEGHAQYSMHDEQSVQAYQTATAHNREVTRLAAEHDIDPKGMTRDAFFKAIEDKVGREQFDAQEAMERARAIDAANEMRDDLQDWQGNEDERANGIDAIEFERLWREANASQELVGGQPGGEQPGVPGGHAGPGQEGAGHGGSGAGDAGPAEGQGPAAGGGEAAAAQRAAPAGEQPAGLTRATEPASGLSEDLKRRTDELPKIGNIRLEYIDEGRYDDVLREVAGQISLSGDPRVRQGAERIAAVNAIMNEAARQHLDAISKYQEAPTPENLVGLEKARLRNAVAFENRSIAATDWAYTGHAQARLIRESKRILQELATRAPDELTLFQRQYEVGLDGQMQTVDQMGKRARDGLLNRYDKIERGLISTFINGLLSNPVTHGGYLIGTQIWNAVRGGFIPVEAAFGAVREMASGQTVDRVLFGEMPAHFVGLYQGAVKGIIPAYRAFRTGETLMEGLGPKAIPMEQQILPTLLGGKIGYVMETPSRVIRAIHVFNYSSAYTAEMYRAAYRDAIRSTGDQPTTYTEFGARMQQFLNNPSEATVEYAHDQAIRATLMRPATRGSFQAGITSTIAKYPLLRVLAPFPQIGMNLAEEGLVRTTPLGVLSPTVRADIAAGGARADRAVGSMVAGSSIAVAAAVAAVNGIITGPGPDMTTEEGRAKMRVLTDQGWTPYAFRWGDSYLPYRKALGPLGTLIGLAATIGDVSKAASAGQAEEAFLRAKTGLREVVLDDTWFRAAHDFFEAVDNWKYQGAHYLRNLAASAVPFSSLMSGMTTQADPYKRQAHTVGEAIEAKIPGLAQTLHPQIGPNGQPILSHSTMGPHALQNDPVNQRRIALGMGVAPWPRELKGVELTDDQQERFARLAGTLSHQMLLPLVTSQGFADLPRGLQMMRIGKMDRDARERAALVVQAESHGELILKQMQVKLRTRMEGRGTAPP